MSLASRWRAWCESLRGPIWPPCRRVISRHRDGDEEVVALECGHWLRLTHQQRAFLPCSECIEHPLPTLGSEASSQAANGAEGVNQKES